jgi:hypothetical protein
MKFLKIVLLTLLAGIAFVFIYANTRIISPAEKLRPVKLSAFSFTNDISADDARIVQHQISAVPGVTACKVNHKTKMASVVYIADKISEQHLADQFKNYHTDAKVKIFEPVKGGCPIHQVDNAVQAFITTLDLRLN